MVNKVTFLNCLIFTVRTLEFLAQVQRYLMDNKATLPGIHSLDIGIYSPYAPIYDELQVYFSELPDIHSLDIGMLSQYEKIADVF